MEHRAWKSARFAYPRAVPTMLQREERQYLFWLGASVWSGAGLVLEIGPWLGGSTVCLAAGMRASGHDARARLHAVDNFLWREFMAARAPLPIKPGESFEPFFLENVADYADIVVSHARALPDEVVSGDQEATAKRFAEARAVPVFDAVPGSDPVEILFIDGAKSWRGMVHLLRVVRDRVVPGCTLLVCQDYKYGGTYWVPMMMSRLGDMVEPVHNVPGGTTVTFRLTRALSADFLAGLVDHVARIPTAEGLALIDRARDLLRADGDRDGAGNVSLARVNFLAHQGRADEAVAAFGEIQREWAWTQDATQLVRAAAYLRGEKKAALTLSPAARAAFLRQRLLGAWRKRFGGGD
jgi:hypothetical protein